MIVHGPYPVGEPRVTREARAALLGGWSVDVVACTRAGEAREEVVEGVNVIRLPITHRRGVGFIATAREYFAFAILAATRVTRRHVRRRYDVIQVHNPPDFLVYAALLPRLMGARLVFDIHDLSPDMFAMRFGGGRVVRTADRVLRAIERHACAVADSIVTVHEPYRRELVTRGVPGDKISVVMNVVDQSRLPSMRASLQRDKRIIYHGTVTPHYGVELLCEAFGHIALEVPDATLEIYGEGDALDGIRGHVEKLGLNDRVRLSGSYIPHREILEAVAGAAVGVVPNLPTRLNRFALSSKLFEFIALGVPVVSADLETIRAHFSDSEVRFFAAGDAAELAAALRDVLGNPNESRARAGRARDRYERDYSWPLQARRYLDLLDTLTQTPAETKDDETRRRGTIRRDDASRAAPGLGDDIA